MGITSATEVYAYSGTIDSQISQPPEEQDVDTPGLRLPDDVWGEIFKLTVVDFPVCVPFKRTEAPSQLIHVCSQWRRVALHTPTLWQAFSCAHLSSEKYVPEVVSLWITRASNRTLSITSLSPACNKKEATFNFERDIVIPNAYRIRELRLNMSGYLPDTYIRPNDFPVLEKLCIERFWSWADPDISPISMFRDAPRLQSASFHQNPPGIDPQDLGHFWPQLHDLHLGSECAPGRFGPILQGLANLQTCKIALSGRFGSITQPQLLTIGSSTLYSLEITYFGHDLDPFFPSLVFPNLRSLAVEAQCPLKLALDIAKNNPYIPNLRLSSEFNYDWRMLRPLLVALPALEALKLPWAILIRESVLHDMANGELVPNLRRLVCGHQLRRAFSNFLKIKGFAGASVCQGVDVADHDLDQMIVDLPETVDTGMGSRSAPILLFNRLLPAPFEYVEISPCSPVFIRDPGVRALSAQAGGRLVLKTYLDRVRKQRVDSTC
ncbi:hypothetical protein BDN72DRAFT_900285 [Pluteus cervinus]|uniref:Uncharacterized protein n=1 Tax=Pluteus cervinus TaxID=181527 RepID=A0ACD3AJI5_9AGAR|nr:hypothetical protein BDN72DRAFT_900285 [Pluteus cervinus]